MKARPTRRRDESGLVATEAALVIPLLVLAACLAASVVVVLAARVGVLDASREAARLAARGESTAAASAAARKLAPPQATVRLRDRQHWVEAVVEAKVRPLRLLPTFTVRASTLAEREDR